jgi:hypothetical protein
MTHSDQDVQAALVKLCDALCTYERNTGNTSTLILHSYNFHFQAVSGKPPSRGISDGYLIALETGELDEN